MKLNKKIEFAKDKIKVTIGINKLWQLVYIKGSELMIKKMAWETFKNTGSIDAFLEFKEIEKIQNKIDNTPPNISIRINESPNSDN